MGVASDTPGDVYALGVVLYEVLTERMPFAKLRTPEERIANNVYNPPADVGDKLPVTLRPSGRVVQARLVTKDRAIAL